MKILLAAIAIAAATAVTLPSAKAQSFSCMETERLNSAEARICRTPSLGHLDERLDSWYRRALERAGYFDQTDSVRSAQRAWLEERNGCGTSVRCLKRAYRTRIYALKTYVEHV